MSHGFCFFLLPVLVVLLYVHERRELGTADLSVEGELDDVLGGLQSGGKPQLEGEIESEEREHESLIRCTDVEPESEPAHVLKEPAQVLHHPFVDQFGQSLQRAHYRRVELVDDRGSVRIDLHDRFRQQAEDLLHLVVDVLQRFQQRFQSF